MIVDKYPWYLKKFMRQFAGCKGTQMYEDIRKGQRVYYAYALQKKKIE
jgi:hypothetical protein